MKTILKFFMSIISLLPVISAEAGMYDGYCYETCYPQTACYEDSCCDAFTLDVKYAAFFPLNSKVQSIYTGALPEFTLEGGWVCGCWGVWVDGSYVFTHGHSKGCGGGPTHLTLVPITLGVKYIYPLCTSTDVYIGLGACYSFLNIRDHSRYVHEKTAANNSGAIVKSGFVYRCSDCMFFEGFFNYMYQKFYFHKTETDPFVYRHDADLSSLQLGIGIGWEF